MSDIYLSQRQAAILAGMALDAEYSAESLASLFEMAPAPATLRRDMQQLESCGFVMRRGEKRGTKYAKTEYGAFLSPFDAHAYFLKETDVRGGLKTYRHGLWKAIPESFFTGREHAAFSAATDAY